MCKGGEVEKLEAAATAAELNGEDTDAKTDFDDGTEEKADSGEGVIETERFVGVCKVDLTDGPQ